MNNEIWRICQCIDFINCSLECAGDIWIGRFVESDVAVTDLHEAEVRSFACAFAVGFREYMRSCHAPTHCPDQAGTRPCHAFQETAPIHAIVAQIRYGLTSCVLIIHAALLETFLQVITGVVAFYSSGEKEWTAPWGKCRAARLFGNHGHGEQGRKQAYCFPAGEMLVKNEPGKQDRDGRVEGSKHDSGVQTSGLGSANE